MSLLFKVANSQYPVNTFIPLHQFCHSSKLIIHCQPIHTATSVLFRAANSQYTVNPFTPLHQFCSELHTHNTLSTHSHVTFVQLQTHNTLSLLFTAANSQYPVNTFTPLHQFCHSSKLIIHCQHIHTTTSVLSQFQTHNTLSTHSHRYISFVTVPNS